jgi:hypothetical protein
MDSNLYEPAACSPGKEKKKQIIQLISSLTKYFYKAYTEKNAKDSSEKINTDFSPTNQTTYTGRTPTDSCPPKKMLWDSFESMRTLVGK